MKRPPPNKAEIALAKLRSFLNTCREHMLPEVTSAAVADLQRRHGADAQVTEYELIRARQHRLGRS